MSVIENTPAPAKAGTNGLAIAGLILAFLIPPIGLILAIVGIIQAGKNNQKGKGLGIFAIFVSVAVMAASIAVFALVFNEVKTLADPGCTTAKSAILDNETAAGNADTAKAGIEATIAGLTEAESKAKDAEVKAAVTALKNDYQLMLEGMTTGNLPEDLLTQVEEHSATFDSLCSIGSE
ncbi:MAG: DUF4190 domain-containing protein [Micromonosporaceae bacterium]|nr:DUF4190 domain-containing protein [Micromonosporaceae bacterium]